MSVEEAADEVCRQSILREKAVGHDAPPLYSPREWRVAQTVLDVCRSGWWDLLPAALEELEEVRRILDNYAVVDDTFIHDYRRGCGAISDALGKLREAALAEMSMELCR